MKTFSPHLNIGHICANFPTWSQNVNDSKSLLLLLKTTFAIHTVGFCLTNFYTLSKRVFNATYS